MTEHTPEHEHKHFVSVRFDNGLAGVYIRVEPNAVRDVVDAISARLLALEAAVDAARASHRSLWGGCARHRGEDMRSAGWHESDQAVCDALVALEAQRDEHS